MGLKAALRRLNAGRGLSNVQPQRPRDVEIAWHLSMSPFRRWPNAPGPHSPVRLMNRGLGPTWRLA